MIGIKRKGTVLIAPVVDWSFLKQLPQQIAEQFSLHGYDVYYCNVSKGEPIIENISRNLHVIHNVELLFDLLESKRIKIDVVYNTWAKNHELIDKINAKTVIYHSCDLFHEWSIYEESMIKKSDIVLCTSHLIYDIRKKQHDNVHLVMNGCSKKMIERLSFPRKDKRAVFIGAIGSWVDTETLSLTADKLDTCLIGKEFGNNCPKNIKLLGEVPHEEISELCKAVKVGLIPFNTKDHVTHGANPIKMWEYLGMGLPVIATPWGETETDELKDVVFTANQGKDFANLALRIASLSDSEYHAISKKAKKIALNNTWEERFKVIEKLIKEAK